MNENLFTNYIFMNMCPLFIDFPWNWLTDLGRLNRIGLHCFVHIPNLVYTITDSVYTFRFLRLFGFTFTLSRIYFMFLSL